MARQFFSGNTIEQALLAAAKHYGLEPNQIAYKHRDKKHGFVNVRRRIVIEVDPAAPKQTVVALPVSEPIPMSRELDRVPEPEDMRRRDESSESWTGLESLMISDEEVSEEEAFESSLRELSELFRGELEHSIEVSEDSVQVDLDGPDSRVLLDEKGRVLQAIEHLLPRLVRGFVGRGVPCRVDCQGFRASRESELRQLAATVADEVRRNASEQLLEPMTPADRRLVHMTLAEDPTVRTQSEGDGFLKRVRICSTE